MVHPATLVATLFGIGYIRPAPGTWGSLAATLIAWALLPFIGPWGLLGAIILVTVLGIWAADRHEIVSGRHDGSEVVIDEVAGLWLTLLPVAFLSDGVMTWQVYAVGFLGFRLFDIWKPWPIRWLDNTLPGGLGTMVDDLAAALPAGLVLWLLYGSLPIL